jgi:hypothetical protein
MSRHELGPFNRLFKTYAAGALLDLILLAAFIAVPHLFAMD